MIRILDIAIYITQYHVDKPYSVTPMKLQKLLYYLKVWGLISGILYVPDKFEKWDYGPVNKEVYHRYKSYGKDPIPPDKVYQLKFGKAVKQFIDFILDCYSPLNAISLSLLTHSESPWVKTKKNYTISDQIIKSYYKTLPFAKNFPLDLENNPFYPVLTDLDYAFTTDMKSGRTESIMVYPSFKEYKKQFVDSYATIEKSYLNFNY